MWSKVVRWSAPVCGPRVISVFPHSFLTHKCHTPVRRPSGLGPKRFVSSSVPVHVFARGVHLCTAPAPRPAGHRAIAADFAPRVNMRAPTYHRSVCMLGPPRACVRLGRHAQSRCTPAGWRRHASGLLAPRAAPDHRSDHEVARVPSSPPRPPADGPPRPTAAHPSETPRAYVSPGRRDLSDCTHAGWRRHAPGLLAPSAAPDRHAVTEWRSSPRPSSARPQTDPPAASRATIRAPACMRLPRSP